MNYLWLYLYIKIFTERWLYSAWLYLQMFFFFVRNNSRQYLVVQYHTKLSLSSNVKTLLLSMTDTRKVIWNWTDLRMFGNACARLVNMTNASCHNQIWKSLHQLIANWYPNKEITWYKQQDMCAMLVHACSVLPDFYDFQSFTILCKLDILQKALWIMTQLSAHNIEPIC